LTNILHWVNVDVNVPLGVHKVTVLRQTIVTELSGITDKAAGFAAAFLIKNKNVLEIFYLINIDIFKHRQKSP